NAGWRAGRLPIGSVGRGLTVATSGGGVVLVHTGWFLRTPSGSLYQFDVFVNETGSCTPLTSSPSPAGSVYQASWIADACNSGGGGCSSAYSGSGCLADWQQGNRAVITVQVGACTPTAFPTVSPAQPTDQNPLLIASVRSDPYFLYDGKRIRTIPAGT